MSTALSWWQLPGPSRLVAAVADDLDRGRCAVLALPTHAPAGFYPALQQTLRALAGQPQRWRCPELPALAGAAADNPAAATTTPQAWLHHYIPAEGPSAEAPATALALAQRPGFGGYRVLLQPATADAPAWLAWLADYQKALAQVRHADRTLFLLILAAKAAPLLPSAGLSAHAYRDQASAADLALHLHFACPRLPQEPPLLHRVRLAVAAAVAAFDVATAVALATGPLSTLLHPSAWLTEWAAQRPWPDLAPAFAPKITDSAAETLWAQGIRANVDGHPCLHPAALARHGDHAALTSRIWEGQLPVLLPFLEQRRQALLRQLSERLRPLLPYQNGAGETMRRLEEIELGDLFHMCVGSRTLHLEPAVRNEIRLLRDCRNRLAHLNPVAEAEVLALAALQPTPPG